MIDFHTCTSLFSNCGSRRLVDLLPHRDAGGEHRTDDCHCAQFVFIVIISLPISAAALRPAIPSRSAGDTGSRLTASSIFGMLPIWCG